MRLNCNNRTRNCACSCDTKCNVKFDITVLLLCSILYWVNILFIRPCGLLFFVSYFNDVCCGVWFVSYSNILLALIRRRIYELKWMLPYIIACGCTWEFLGPILNCSRIYDLMDIIAYSIGALVYWVLEQCRRRISRS